MTDKQTDETLDPPVFRLKQMRRLLAEHNYYGRPIDDDFAALDAAIAALERQREGWKLVPVIPTGEMLWEGFPLCSDEEAWDNYINLLAAAPEVNDE